MSVRTLAGMIASVQRSLAGASTKVPPGDIAQAIVNTNLQVNARWTWPWLYKETVIGLNGPYTTGTVSLTPGSTAVVGVGTTWDTSWAYKRLTTGTDNIDYLVASFGSTTAATLVQAPHIAAAQTDVSYTIFQDIYAMPSDWSPGTDLILSNVNLRYRVKKIPTYTLAEQNISNRLLFTSFQAAYSDYGYDDTNKLYLIRLTPPPGASAEFQMVYRQRAPNLSATTDTSRLPEEFCEYLELMAEANVKRIHRIPGYQQAESKAVVLLNAMKKQIATQNVNNQPADHGDAFGGDSSFQDGMVGISPGWRS